MGTSKSIIYENCDDGIKSQILSKFKEIYSKTSITEIEFYYKSAYDAVKKKLVFEIYIEIKLHGDSYSVIFNNKVELINFVKKLGRQFIIIDYQTKYCIYFVYNPEKQPEELLIKI